MDSKSSKHFKVISCYNNIPKMQYEKVAYNFRIIHEKETLKTNNLNFNN